MAKQRVELTINGRTYSDEVEPRTLLSDFIRHHAGLTGTHVGCEHDPANDERHQQIQERRQTQRPRRQEHRLGRPIGHIKTGRTRGSCHEIQKSSARRLRWEASTSASDARATEPTRGAAHIRSERVNAHACKRAHHARSARARGAACRDPTTRVGGARARFRVREAFSRRRSRPKADRRSASAGNDESTSMTTHAHAPCTAPGERTS